MDVQLKRGLLDVCVLAAIRHEDSYGYKIIKDIEALYRADGIDPVSHSEAPETAGKPRPGRFPGSEDRIDRKTGTKYNKVIR